MPVIRLLPLTIPSGAQVSNALPEKDFRWSRSMVILSPVAITGIYTIEVSDPIVPVTADWRTLQSGGSDVTLAAGKALVLDTLPFRNLRLATSGTPVADEVFDVTAQEDSGF